MGIVKGEPRTLNDLLEFLRENKFYIEPTLDGELIRFDRNGTGNAWLCAREIPRDNGEPPLIVATVGDWKTGEKHEFKSVTKFASKEEEAKVKAYLKKAKKEADAQKEKDQEDAAKNTEPRWKELSDSGNSTYLSLKGVQGSFGQRYGVIGNLTSIYIPCKDIAGKLWGCQKIQDDGQKFFTPGQKVKGCFHTIGEITNKVFICEGFATGASIYMATGTATVCAFGAGNLKDVATAIRSKYGNIEIVIACDNDQNKIGETAGREAAIAASASFVVAQTTNGTDFNDLHVSEGLSAVKAQLEKITKTSEIIPTELTGFHTTEWRGNKLVHIPQYEDLRKFFEKQHSYKMLNGSGIVLVWNGKYYQQMEDAYLKAFAQKHFNPTANNYMVSEFLGIVTRHHLTPGEWFETTTKRKINFQNGVLDMQTMEFGPHSEAYGFRYALDYDYDVNAKCPTFDKFISEITGSDKELEAVLLEYAGYAISNDRYWIQKALVLEGEGSNGKSTFMNVLRRLAGHNNYSSFSLSDLRDKNNRQMLDGRLFNMAEETPPKAMQESSLFKNLTGGGETHARLLYKNVYKFRNKAKLIFACNELPPSNDVTHGYIRRFLIVPFKQKFSKELGNLDQFIEKKLFKELPGIFIRIITAYKDVVVSESFTDAKASAEALTQYKRDIDPILTFLTEAVTCYPLGNGHDATTSTISELYSAYTAKTKSDGFPISDKSVFGRRLRLEIPDYDKRYKRTKNERFLIGVERTSGENF